MRPRRPAPHVALRLSFLPRRFLKLIALLCAGRPAVSHANIVRNDAFLVTGRAVFCIPGAARLPDKDITMTFGSIFRRLRASLTKSAGTVVFGMEDGTVSIFGLIFGVAATTTSTQTVVIAGASGAVAAAVSMMAGVYLDAETTNDALAAKRVLAQSDLTSQCDAIVAALPNRLDAAGLTREQTAALTGAVRDNPAALCALHVALEDAPGESSNPWEQALWMLLADFAAAAVPIVPFVLLPIPQARVVSGAVTLMLLIGLCVGRARVAKRNMLRTILETVSIGIAAALAGVGVSVLIDRGFGG
jgi:VIT1/CCC1 family predicted Fe2+/Mn2+ transporter